MGKHDAKCGSKNCKGHPPVAKRVSVDAKALELLTNHIKCMVEYFNSGLLNPDLDMMIDALDARKL